MSEEYQRITKILVWIVALSMVAYFVLTPLTFLRPTPSAVAPQAEEVAPTTSPATESAPTNDENIDIFGTGTAPAGSSQTDSGQAGPVTPADTPVPEPTQ